MLITKFARYIYNKIKFSRTVSFDHTCNIIPDSLFEGVNRIGSKSSFRGKMGYGSYIGNSCNIQATIGRFCSFGESCKTIFWKHPITYPYVSTSPIFYSTRKQCGYTFAKYQAFKEILEPPVFGNDIWCGSNVIFIGSVKIGNGAVILTNAVVTKDVEPYSIVGGIPAKHLKYRYEKEDIDFLIASKWWEKPIEWLEEHWTLINNLELFKDYMMNHSE